jgi:hypothetical protein
MFDTGILPVFPLSNLAELERPIATRDAKGEWNADGDSGRQLDP